MAGRCHAHPLASPPIDSIRSVRPARGTANVAPHRHRRDGRARRARPGRARGQGRRGRHGLAPERTPGQVRRAPAAAYLEEFEVSYPSLYDQPSRLPQLLRGDGGEGPPYTLVVDAQGRIAARIFGVLGGGPVAPRSRPSSSATSSTRWRDDVRAGALGTGRVREVRHRR